jgi:hypothetical protein
MRHFLSAVFIAVLAFGCASGLQAQALYGTLVGNVVDATQGIVPGATVKIADTSTGVVREAVTTDRGEYIFSNVPVGTYAVTVNRQGFKETLRNGVRVGADQTFRVDVTLEVGAVSERIEVSAEAAILQTDRAEIRGEVSTTQYQNLPVPPNRNYEQLLSTIPGVMPMSGSQGISNSPSNPGIFTMNGQSGATRSTRIDGAAEVNVWLAGSVAYVPSLEAIQAVNVVTNSVDAETGGAAGGSVSLTIKSGTNQFHGAGFESHSDAAVVSRSPILPASSTKPPLTFNQFGGSIGGPVKKDKLFFFASYDGTLSRASSARLWTVPTALQKAGDLSGTSNPGVTANPIYDPNTGTPDGKGRTPFVGNLIPATSFDPIMTKLLAKLPLPNLGGLTNNYFTNLATNRNTHILDAKINWNPTSKLTTFARLGYVDSTAFNANAFDAQGIGGPVISNGNIAGKTYNTTYAATYAVGPTLLFDGNVGWTMMTTNIEQLGIGTNLGLAAGIPGTNGPAKYQSGWPMFIPQAGTYSSFGTDNQWMPWHRWDPQYNYTGNGTWVAHSHQLRFGAELLIQAMNHEQAEYTSGGTAYGAQGGFGFPGQLTTLNGGPASNQLNAMASLLMGLVGSNGKNVMPDGILATRQHFYSAYVRDQWQITPKLTANFGVRWEYYPLLTRQNRGIEVYNFTNNNMSLCGYQSIPDNCGVEQNKWTFGPRAGLAYRVTPTFVVRAGYSLAYDPTPLVRQFRGNYPALVSYFVQSGANSASSFAPVSLVKDGIQPIPVPSLGNGIIPVPGNISIATVQNQFRRGYIQTWNFTLEKQLTSSITGSVGYVATRANGILNSLDYNAGAIGCNAACQPLNIAFGRTAATQVILPIGNSHYDSLQARVTKRFSQGYSLGIAYTFQKSIGQNLGYALPQYASLYRGNMGLPTFYLNINGSYELPFGKGKAFLNNNRVASAVLGGWQTNGVFSVNAGAGFGVTSSAPLNAVNGPSQRANVVGPLKILGGLGPGNLYFDPTAFAAGPANTIGNAGPNIMYGPTAYNLDASVFRNFRLTERFQGSVRLEAFNATNTPHWGNPNANVSAGNFGIITGLRATGREGGMDQRQLQGSLRFQF